MTSIIAIGIFLAFILFGALERMVPKAGKLLGVLSGLSCVLLILWGMYLGGSWGLAKTGVSPDQLVAFLNPGSWLKAL